MITTVVTVFGAAPAPLVRKFQHKDDKAQRQETRKWIDGQKKLLDAVDKFPHDFAAGKSVTVSVQVADDQGHVLYSGTQTYNFVTDAAIQAALAADKQLLGGATGQLP